MNAKSEPESTGRTDWRSSTEHADGSASNGCDIGLQAGQAKAGKQTASADDRIGWPYILFWVAMFKIAYMGILATAVWLWPDYDEQRFTQVSRDWFEAGAPLPGPPEHGLTRHFATWDAQHYLVLSQGGYKEGIRSCAFYPLWPLTVRAFAVVTGGNHVIAGMVLANLFSMAAWTLFYVNVARRFGERTGLWALVFLILFPGSLFYQFIYSEALFFLLAMLLWFGLERGRYRIAFFAAFLLPLSRAIGVFMVLPLAWHWLMRCRWSWLDRWPWLRVERERTTSLLLLEAEKGGRQASAVGLVFPSGTPGWAALASAPLLGFAVCLGLMWVWTGNPLEAFKAQKHWGMHSIGNLWDIPKFAMGLVTPAAWHYYNESLLDRLAFILLLYSLPVIWRLGKDMMVWTYVLGILPAMSGTFTSFTRYACCAFPVFIALAVFTERKGWGPLRWILLAAFGILHVVLVWRFVNFRWAG